MRSEACRQLVLIRGLPGSGKTTLARTLVQAGFKHFEADMFFTNDEGEYEFDGKNLWRAHEWCQRQVEEHLGQGHNVVVSNTFTQRWEMEPYLSLAEQYGIQPNIIKCESQFGNIHGVPEESIKRMRDRWEEFK